MKTLSRETDNRWTLAWVDHTLEHARGGGKEKLGILLRTVRAEIVFEMVWDSGVLDYKSSTNEENG